MKQKLQILLVFSTCFLFSNWLYGQLNGQLPLNPKAIPQFVDPLPHFAGARVDASGGILTINYEPCQQVAVSTGTILPNGAVVGTTPGAGLGNYWGYSVSNGIVTMPAHWPAFSVEAKRNSPVNVTYANNLINQTYASVNLKADQTLHWADPLGDMHLMPMAPYTGDIPVSPHLHGGEVASESDGGPDSWFTPGYAIKGPSWALGVDETYYYPNTQEGATLWYHDHALGVTRLNVYAGLAGFYFLRDASEDALHLPGWSGDGLVKEVAVNANNTVNPNPYLPEIEVAIQDRMFDTNGALYFPNLPTNPMVHPFWNPEFLGDVITVNGKTWPYLSVAPRKYRFRILNGSNARFYELQLESNGPVKKLLTIMQIGTDGGFLDVPVNVTALGGKLLLAPGERADVIVDFSKAAPGQTWTLTNTAKAPFPGGTIPNPATTGRIMKFVVNGTMVTPDNSVIPASLRTTPLVKLTNFAGATTVTPTVKRQLTLNEVMGMGGPLEVLVNNSKWDMNGMMTPGLGETEIPTEGTTEIWQIINMTADAHPIHLHLVQFQLVGRQPFNTTKYNAAYAAAFPGGIYQPSVGPPLAYNTPNADGAIGGNPAVTSSLMKKVVPANLNEQGWKDTFIAYPGEVTTFAIRYAPTDIPTTAAASALLFGFDPSQGPGYVWHCHIIDHEDNEMMRPYTVQPSPARALAPVLANAALKSGTITSSKIVEAGLGFSLDQNFPNPGKYETEIRFQVPEAMHVRLSLFNQLGQQVKVLIDNTAPAGNNRVVLNREGLPNGVYFYRLQAGSNVATRKMILQ